LLHLASITIIAMLRNTLLFSDFAAIIHSIIGSNNLLVGSDNNSINNNSKRNSMAQVHALDFLVTSSPISS
jgi:hypothetical protein